MIGCGFPDLHAEKLASNLEHDGRPPSACAAGLGGIYSEGGGTAYLVG